MKQNDNKASDAFRAGKYVMQIAGYKAFIPNPLPPNPPIYMDEELLALLSNADMALGRLDGLGDTVAQSRPLR